MSAIMPVELKPCPFCGELPDLLKSLLEEKHTKRKGEKETVTQKRYVIRCNHCGAMSAPTNAVEDEAPNKSCSVIHIIEAINNWNRRAEE